jgi:hypothetical protein
MAILGLLTCSAGWTGDEKPEVVASRSPNPNLPATLKATSPARQPLNLLLTQAELRFIIRNYEIRTGEVLTAPIVDDEVLVTAPGMLAPMRDVSQDVGTGLYAPFWAITHSKDAWRIFLPVPSKGPSKEAETPAPDPR